MNRGEIRNAAVRILTTLASPIAPYGPDDLNAAINNGITDICLRGKVYEKAGTLTVVGTTASYDLASDFLEMVSVATETGKTLDEIVPAQVGRVFITATVGGVMYYYIFNKGVATDFQITFHPAPSAGVGVTYAYKYRALDVAIIVDGTSPNFPTRYHLALAYYVAWECAMRRGKLQEAMGFELVYFSLAGIKPPPPPPPPLQPQGVM